MAEKKKKIFSGNKWQIFVIAVIAVMAVTVVILRFIFNITPENSDTSEERNLEEMLNNILPEEGFNLFSKSLSSGSEEKLLSAEVSITSAYGEERTAYYSKPAGAGPFPSLLLIHGGASSQKGAERLSTVIGERIAEEIGVSALSVNWSESEMGTNDLADVLAALEWLKEQNGDKPIFIFGMDYGAYLGILAATEKESPIDGVIAGSGIYDPLKHYNWLKEKDNNKAEKYLYLTGCDTVVQIESCLGQYVLAATQPLLMPFLIFHNKQDAEVAYAQSEFLATLVKDSYLTMNTFDNAEMAHDIFSSPQATGFNEVWGVVKDWLQRRVISKKADPNPQPTVSEAVSDIVEKELRE